MTKTKTLREHIVDNALELLEAGVAAEIVGEELLLAGVGVMLEARGRDETIARLERLIEKLPDPSLAAEPRFRQ